MEFLAVITILVVIVAAYFFTGMVAMWIWEWWILAVSLPIALFVGFSMGFVGAIVGLIGLMAAVWGNNAWHSTAVYFAVADRIEKAFHFKDT